MKKYIMQIIDDYSNKTSERSYCCNHLNYNKNISSPYPLSLTKKFKNHNYELLHNSSYIRIIYESIVRRTIEFSPRKPCCATTRLLKEVIAYTEITKWL